MFSFVSVLYHGVGVSMSHDLMGQGPCPSTLTRRTSEESHTIYGFLVQNNSAKYLLKNNKIVVP